jgi:peptidoglycan/LPS O-acetylase OafA/YrhL
VRGFLFGLILLFGLGLTVLSFRPGGIRRQLRFVARRFRIMLVLGAIFVAGSTIIRAIAPQGVVADYGPPAIAIVLAAVFMIVGRDPSGTTDSLN